MSHIPGCSVPNCASCEFYPGGELCTKHNQQSHCSACVLEVCITQLEQQLAEVREELESAAAQIRHVIGWSKDALDLSEWQHEQLAHALQHAFSEWETK